MTIFIFLLQVRPESFQILSCMSCLKLFRILHTSHASLRFSYLNNRWKPWSNGYGRRLTLGSNPSPDGHFVTSIFYKKLYCFFLIKYQQKRKDRPGWQFLNNITFLVLKICTNGIPIAFEWLSIANFSCTSQSLTLDTIFCTSFHSVVNLDQV